MAVSLYDATVAGFLRGVGAMQGVLAKGMAHCRESGIDPAEIVETRLYPDMAPFRYQVMSIRDHSIGAINGVRAGVFSPGRDPTPHDYDALQGILGDTLAALNAIAPGDVDALVGGDVEFRLGERSMPFTAEGFLLSFSVPNFHFHSTTAYDILRSKGVPLGKRDYLGKLTLKA